MGAKDYLASPAAEGRLKERRESLFPWVNESTYLVRPDRFVDKPESLTVGELTIEIKPFGSTHSDGDLSMLVKPDNVLLTGDLIFEGRIPFVAGSKPQRWLDQLETLEVKDIKAIIPGHGPVADNPADAINDTKNYLEFLQKAMGQAVEELIPFDDAYKATDWSRYKNMPAFRVNRMNAYFMYLNLEDASVQ